MGSSTWHDTARTRLGTARPTPLTKWVMSCRSLGRGADLGLTRGPLKSCQANPSTISPTGQVSPAVADRVNWAMHNMVLCILGQPKVVSQAQHASSGQGWANSLMLLVGPVGTAIWSPIVLTLAARLLPCAAHGVAAAASGAIEAAAYMVIV